MKKIFSMLCVVLVVGFAGTAFAGKAEKVDVCHNGLVYVGDISDGALYDPDAWEPGSFVINISGNAVTKHQEKHGDFLNYAEGSPVTTLVEVNEGIITGFETQMGCTEVP